MPNLTSRTRIQSLLPVYPTPRVTLADPLVPVLFTSPFHSRPNAFFYLSISLAQHKCPKPPDAQPCWSRLPSETPGRSWHAPHPAGHGQLLPLLAKGAHQEPAGARGSQRSARSGPRRRFIRQHSAPLGAAQLPGPRAELPFWHPALPAPPPPHGAPLTCVRAGGAPRGRRGSGGRRCASRAGGAERSCEGRGAPPAHAQPLLEPANRRRARPAPGAGPPTAGAAASSARTNGERGRCPAAPRHRPAPSPLHRCPQESEAASSPLPP